ncbi:hypothetical protein LCGC14_0569420 [marine sediment metagenome]|uniref:Radical SAM protein n=1 Tax=marine sediment metagenome TaxID=412755 RepID=A0A0F9USU5_9ZZZZ
MAAKPPTITEQDLFKHLDRAKNVLLLEPNYRRSYMPLALAKIATYIKDRGGQITFSRSANVDPGPSGKFDLICVTSIFTTDSKIVIAAIKECKRDMFLAGVPLIVGGIFASLMPEYLYKEAGAPIFVGYSRKLDKQMPDYTIDWQVKPPWDDAMLVFTTRGCPNKCGYCMVWRMEPEFYIEPKWKDAISKNDKPIAIISDNNLLAAPIEHLRAVVQTLNDNQKQVIFNNGIDCRLINNQNAKLLATLKYTRNGFRTAFDRMSDDGHYQQAMEMVIAAGLKVKGNSYTYVLFNFDDTPQEAYYRARECWKYGSNPYLMRYRPLNQATHRLDYVSKYWSPALITAFSNYGQNFGYNRKDGTFESWIKGYTEGGKWKYKSKLTDNDWDKWHYKR